MAGLGPSASDNPRGEPIRDFIDGVFDNDGDLTWEGDDVLPGDAGTMAVPFLPPSPISDFVPQPALHNNNNVAHMCLAIDAKETATHHVNYVNILHMYAQFAF